MGNVSAKVGAGGGGGLGGIVQNYFREVEEPVLGQG